VRLSFAVKKMLESKMPSGKTTLIGIFFGTIALQVVPDCPGARQYEL
jgi:hypothetical protein